MRLPGLDLDVELPPVLTPDEVAALLLLSRETVRKRCANGLLPSDAKPQGRTRTEWLIARETVVAALADQASERLTRVRQALGTERVVQGVDTVGIAAELERAMQEGRIRDLELELARTGAARDSLRADNSRLRSAIEALVREEPARVQDGTGPR